jgi:hypothetical protein
LKNLWVNNYGKLTACGIVNRHNICCVSCIMLFFKEASIMDKDEEHSC